MEKKLWWSFAEEDWKYTEPFLVVCLLETGILKETIIIEIRRAEFEADRIILWCVFEVNC